jgi:polyhydroxyalkanoate synthase
MAKATEARDGGHDTGSPAEQYVVKDPERFALNMARVVEQAGKAAAAWAALERGDVQDKWPNRSRTWSRPSPR